MPAVRVRQHVNPLSDKYQQPVAPPNWAEVYGTVQPLHLDIGCARGQFLLEMAQQRPDWNFLGLEIRETLVHQANQSRDQLGLPNLHYIFCNANNSLQPMLASFPADILQRVSIQFPDPWFKKRHHKRRVVQPDLVVDLATYMPLGSTVFLQSDVEAVALEMAARFGEHAAFSRQEPIPWLAENPLPVQTERERSTLEMGEPVFRTLFIRQ